MREYDLRKDFYEKLSSFAKPVDFLYASYGLFESVGFEKSEEYRRDYLLFKKLKDSVSLRFNDSVDFSKYEDGIRQLLNTYVNAEDAKIIIEPLDILNKDKMQEQLAKLGSKQADHQNLTSHSIHKRTKLLSFQALHNLRNVEIYWYINDLVDILELVLSNRFQTD